VCVRARELSRTKIRRGILHLIDSMIRLIEAYIILLLMLVFACPLRFELLTSRKKPSKLMIHILKNKSIIQTLWYIIVIQLVGHDMV
jgi:hypothetical protein